MPDYIRKTGIKQRGMTSTFALYKLFAWIAVPAAFLVFWVWFLGLTISVFLGLTIQFLGV